MRKAAVIASTALVGTLGFGAAEVSAHQHGCHSAHSCPSDHHTYVWYDASGQGWSCARPGSDTYDPGRDTTTHSYDGYTYYCYTYGSLPPPPPPPLDSDGDGVLDSGDASQTAPRRTVERVEQGSVVAELSYVKRRRRSGGFIIVEYRDMRMRVVRAGQELRNEAVPRRCARGCSPSGPPLRIRDLNGDGELEVVVDLFTGGASCCVLSVIYGFSPSESAYRRTVVDFGSGYQLRNYGADSLVEFVGGDYRFKYAFSCGACSPQPLRIWQYNDHALIDASRRFPTQLRRQARRMYRLYQRVRRGRDVSLVKGVLPAYAADMCRIRRCARAFRVIQRARKRGEFARQGRYDIPPFDQAYVKALKRFLRRTGYLR